MPPAKACCMTVNPISITISTRPPSSAGPMMSLVTKPVTAKPAPSVHTTSKSQVGISSTARSKPWLAAIKRVIPMNLPKQCRDIGHNLRVLAKSKSALAGINLVQQRLGCCAEHDSAAALLSQKIQRVIQQVDAPDRNSLNLIEDQHRPRHLVHTANRPRTRSKKPLEKLYSGRKYNRGVPILRQNLAFPSLLKGSQIRVMLQHNAGKLGPVRLQNIPNDLGVLIDDRRIRTYINDAIHPPLGRMVERETEAGERLAPARGNGQKISTLRALRGEQTGAGDFPPKLVDRGLGTKTTEPILQQSRKRGPFGVLPALTQGTSRAARKIGGIRVVGVNQAAKQKPDN